MAIILSISTFRHRYFDLIYSLGLKIINEIKNRCVKCNGILLINNIKSSRMVCDLTLQIFYSLQFFDLFFFLNYKHNILTGREETNVLYLNNFFFVCKQKTFVYLIDKDDVCWLGKNIFKLWVRSLTDFMLKF